MDEKKIGAVKIIENYEPLSDKQKQQFRRIVMHGLKGKFENTVSDEAVIQQVVDLWCRYGLLPMDETYAAIDEVTSEVLGILMMNNFKTPNLLQQLKSTLTSIRIGGFKNTFKLAYPFVQLDSYNRKLLPHDASAEIYLIAVNKYIKGRGVGTQLMDHVLREIHSKCRCGQPGGLCSCKVMLLVFEKNPAMHLYERMGFTEADRLATPRLKKAFGDGYDTLIRMEKPL